MKNGFKFTGLFSTLAACLIGVSASATVLKDQKELGWVSKRDLTSSQFATEFNKYKNGYVMIDIDGYQVGNSVRYSMVWRKNTDGRAWAEHRNLSSAQYSSKWNYYRDRGYRPLDIAAYQNGSQLQFAGIWVKNLENIAWSSHRNLTSQSYGTIYSQKRAAGYRLVDMEAYQTSSGLRYSAIWYKNTDNRSWTQLRNMTRSTYLQQVSTKGSQGYMVVDYERYSTPSGTRYAAIWEKKPGYAYQLRTNRTEKQFANLWREYRDKGYRLVDFERHGNSYAGIWLENDSRYRYNKKSQLNNAVTDYLDDNSLPGISVAVIQNGTTLYRRGFGFADVLNNKVAHSGTVYNSASVSKVIGATLAAKLEQEQQLRSGSSFYLDLSDRTDAYLTNAPARHTHTVEELLSHYACIPHYDTNPGIANQTTHYWTATSAVQSIWNNNLITGCSIGTNRNYSTHAFTYVAAVLEQATNRTIRQLLDNELFNPYGLSSMRMQYGSNFLPYNYERAVPYSDSNLPTSYSNNSWKALGGGIETNVYDLARFGWKVLNGQIVDANTRDNRLWTRADASFWSSQGLAWRLRTKNGGKRVAEHGGSWTGARSFLRAYRDDGLVIAIMSNRTDHNDANDIDDLADELADIVFD